MRSSKVALAVATRALPVPAACAGPQWAHADEAAPASAAPAASAAPNAPTAAAPLPDPPAPPSLTPGGYQGVTPGLDHLPPKPARATAKGAPRLMWTGFQPHEPGRATVFLELSRPAAFVVDDKASADGKGGVLTYTLQGVAVPLSNNRRPLDVSAFGGAVRSVATRRHGRDVEVVIEYGGKVTHAERSEAAAGGFKLLLIDITG